MVSDGEIKMAIFVHVPEGHAPPTGDGRPEPFRRLPPGSFPITQPHMRPLTQTGERSQVEEPVPIDVGKDRRTLPYPIVRKPRRCQNVLKRWLMRTHQPSATAEGKDGRYRHPRKTAPPHPLPKKLHQHSPVSLTLESLRVEV